MNSENSINDTLKKVLLPKPRKLKEYFKEIKSQFGSKPEQSEYISFLKTDQSIANYKEMRQKCSKIQRSVLSKWINDIYVSNDQTFTDLEISIDDQIFYLHRLIIACFIPVMFYKLSKISEIREIKSIKLIGIESKSFKIILKFIYTGEMEIQNEDSFFLVLDNALRLFMIEFAKMWINLYETQFNSTISLILHKRYIAHKFGWKEFYEPIKQLISLDFENFILTQDFYELNVEELMDYLKDHRIGVRDEMMLYLAALKWLNHDWETRRWYALQLMQLISFSSMTDNQRKACLDPLIFKQLIQIKGIKDLIQNLIRENQTRITRQYKSGKPLKLWTIEGSDPQNVGKESIKKEGLKQNIVNEIISHEKRSNEKNIKEKVFNHKEEHKLIKPNDSPIYNLIDKTDEEKILKQPLVISLEKMNSSDEKYAKSSKLESLTHEKWFSRIKLILYSEKLAKIEDKSLWQSSINRLGETLLWKKKSIPSNFPNIWSPVVIGVENSVYFFGGIKAETKNSKKGKKKTKVSLKAINECYRFDDLKEKIISIKSMKECRVLHGAALIDHKVYIVGGFVNKKTMSNRVEIYDLVTHDFKLLDKPMNVSRIGMAVSSFQKRLCIIGGINRNGDKNILLNDFIVYDPKLDKWFKMKEKYPQYSSYMSAIEHQSKLYVIGGYGKSDAKQKSLQVLNNVWIFDPKSQKWTEGPPLNIAKCKISAVSVGSLILAIGGSDGNDVKHIRSDTMEILDTSLNELKWVKSEKLPIAVSGHCLAVINSN